MSTVLVVGGAGYIGSHACKALAEAGYDVVVFDNLAYGHEWAVQWGPLEKGDILDRERLDDAMRRHRPQAVMHFAAFCYVGESVTDPAKYYRNNVIGTLNLLDAMRARGVERLVFSSTCATYGDPVQIPMREDHPQRPVNPYGWSKLMIERVMRDYGVAYGLRSVALRYFNAAGADSTAQIGEDHDPETHLIPLALLAAVGVRPSLTIYGDDYDTPDGTCIRDYIHVSDLAQAHVLALSRLERISGFDAYNLGNGAGFSVKQVIDTAAEVTGRSIPAEIGLRRAGDPPRLIGDATRARHELGWAPRFAELSSIVESAWRWTIRNT